MSPSATSFQGERKATRHHRIFAQAQSRLSLGTVIGPSREDTDARLRCANVRVRASPSAGLSELAIRSQEDSMSKSTLRHAAISLVGTALVVACTGVRDDDPADGQLGTNTAALSTDVCLGGADTPSLVPKWSQLYTGRWAGSSVLSGTVRNADVIDIPVRIDLRMAGGDARVITTTLGRERSFAARRRRSTFAPTRCPFEASTSQAPQRSSSRQPAQRDEATACTQTRSTPLTTQIVLRSRFPEVHRRNRSTLERRRRSRTR